MLSLSETPDCGFVASAGAAACAAVLKNKPFYTLQIQRVSKIWKQPDENGRPGKARPKPALSEYACPDCGKPLVKRSGAKGEFYGCSGYPGCKKSWPVAPNGAPDFNAKKRGK